MLIHQTFIKHLLCARHCEAGDVEIKVMISILQEVQPSGEIVQSRKCYDQRMQWVFWEHLKQSPHPEGVQGG